MKSCLVAALLMGTAMFSPVQAQSVEDMNARLDQMEGQMRTLVGQVEELTYNMKQLQSQLGAPKKTGAAEPCKLKSLNPQQPVVAEQGVNKSRTIRCPPRTWRRVQTNQLRCVRRRDQRFWAPCRAQWRRLFLMMVVSRARYWCHWEVRTANLPWCRTVMPLRRMQSKRCHWHLNRHEALYEHSNESLLRRQFGEAEQGFRGFLISILTIILQAVPSTGWVRPTTRKATIARRPRISLRATRTIPRAAAHLTAC